MNELQQEISELKQFVADLKADRAAAKEKERKEAWTKYVSLTIVIIAVIAAIAAQWSGKYGGRVQISQAQASDQWAFYQSKSIKQHLFEVSRTQLAKSANANDPEVAKEQKKFEDTVARYEREKAEIKAKAEGLENVRDDAGRRGARMGLACSLLSVSIAMASICTVTKRKPLWFIAIALAAVGVFEMVTAWLM
jgi:Domain of unknown function (DUF4337)